MHKIALTTILCASSGAENMASSNVFFQLFPNPTTAEVSLSIVTQQDFLASWELLTEDGRKIISSGKIAVQKEHHLEKINLSNQPSGIYVFRLKREDGREWSSQVFKL